MCEILLASARLTKRLSGSALVAIAALVSGFPFTTFAQEKYPARPITLVVGFPAGGQSDILARLLASNLGPILKQPVVVENKPGASSTIATHLVARTKADGYTLLLGGSTACCITPLVMKGVLYDPINDFKPIALLTSALMSISVNPSVPANNLRELIALIKANPGKYSYASGGFGNVDHLTGELFKQKAGNLDLLHVPYKGAAPATNDVIAGHVPILSTTLSSIYQYSKSGKLRILAVTGTQRSPSAPEIPTAIEAGVPDFVANVFNFLTAPAGTPAPVIETLSAAVAKIMADPSFIDQLIKLQFEPFTKSTPESTEEYIKSNLENWRKVVIAGNIEPE